VAASGRGDGNAQAISAFRQRLDVVAAAGWSAQRASQVRDRLLEVLSVTATSFQAV
jgi:hypothetical protein